MERRLAQAFGLSSPVSFGRFDPNTCLLRTYQASLFTTECDTSSENFPDSGMWGAGSVYELQTSELPTSESASSSWLTPMERDRQSSEPKGQTQLTQQAEKWPTASSCVANDGETVETWERRRQENLAKGYNGNGQGTPLTIAAIRWPTAQATDSASAARHTTETGIMHPGTSLTDAIRMWPTARSEGSESCGNHPGATDSLTGATRLWSTPRTITGGGESAERKQELGRTESGGGDLQSQTEHWQTPNARDWKSETGSENNSYDKTPNLSRQVYRISRQDPAIPDGLTSSETDRTLRRLWQTPKDTGGGNSSRSGDRKDELLLKGEAAAFMQDQAKRLSPRFVEWLMGFPIGWTER